MQTLCSLDATYQSVPPTSQGVVHRLKVRLFKAVFEILPKLAHVTCTLVTLLIAVLLLTLQVCLVGWLDWDYSAANCAGYNRNGIVFAVSNCCTKSKCTVCNHRYVITTVIFRVRLFIYILFFLFLNNLNMYLCSFTLQIIVVFSVLNSLNIDLCSFNLQR